jgi:hypothetical protein
MKRTLTGLAIAGTAALLAPHASAAGSRVCTPLDYTDVPICVNVPPLTR